MATTSISPSPPKPKFSFAGGGGWRRPPHTPPFWRNEEDHPSQPMSLLRYDGRRGGDVHITVVLLDARFLDALRRHGLSPHASELILAPSSPLTLPNNTIKGLGLLLRHLVHACADVYFKQGDMLTISFRRSKVFLSVKSAVAGGGSKMMGQGWRWTGMSCRRSCAT